MRKLLIGINTSKSQGPDGLHPKLIYELAYVIWASDVSVGTSEKAGKSCNVHFQNNTVFVCLKH